MGLDKVTGCFPGSHGNGGPNYYGLPRRFWRQDSTSRLRWGVREKGVADACRGSVVRAGGCAIVLSHQDVLIWVPLTHAGDVPLAHFESSLQAWQSRSWLARLGPQSLCHVLAMAQTVSREPGPGLGR